jgi:hypothetical protein
MEKSSRRSQGAKSAGSDEGALFGGRSAEVRGLSGAALAGGEWRADGAGQLSVGGDSDLFTRLCTCSSVNDHR